MNENIDLCEILKDCQKGTKLYSTFYGTVTFFEIDKDCLTSKIIVYHHYGRATYNSNGVMNDFPCGECTLFPSKGQRDWSKFKVNKPKFDPKNLHPFDKVLVRCHDNSDWFCNIFSHIEPYGDFCFCSNDTSYKMCIPYNEETKHLVGTADEAPEFYRYWEE